MLLTVSKQAQNGWAWPRFYFGRDFGQIVCWVDLATTATGRQFDWGGWHHRPSSRPRLGGQPITGASLGEQDLSFGVGGRTLPQHSGSHFFYGPYERLCSKPCQ
jgi:hypothetical protein